MKWIFVTFVIVVIIVSLVYWGSEFISCEHSGGELVRGMFGYVCVNSNAP